MSLSNIGALFRIAGLIVVGVEALKTWRQFAPDEPIVSALLGQRRLRLVRQVERRLRGFRGTSSREITAWDAASGQASAHDATAHVE